MVIKSRQTDYAPGGEGYRYAYNGMEHDGEVSGDGNSYTTEFRQYDPRLGRWKSLDPLMAQFPWMSPYVAFDNNPIYYVDPYGLSAGEPPGYDGCERGEVGYGDDGSEWIWLEKPPNGIGPLEFEWVQCIAIGEVVVTVDGCAIDYKAEIDRINYMYTEPSFFEPVLLFDTYNQNDRWTKELRDAREEYWMCLGYQRSDMQFLHELFDLIGFIPVVGELFDVLNAIAYTAEGDLTNAGISIAGIVPLAGDELKAILRPFAKNAVKVSDDIGEVVLRNVDELPTRRLSNPRPGIEAAEINRHANDIINSAERRAKKNNAGFESGRHQKWMREAAQDLRNQAKTARKKGMLPEIYERLERRAEQLERRAHGTGHRGGRTGRGKK